VMTGTKEAMNQIFNPGSLDNDQRAR